MSTSSIISMIVILTITIGGFAFLAKFALNKDNEKKEMNG